MILREDITPIQDSREYVLWRRVSTQKQGESGLGLEAQLSIAQLFMGRNPIEVYTDVYTGTDLKGCEALWEAVERVKREGLLLVIAKTDRFRNVAQACEVLDAVGDRNMVFCDIQTNDRTILQIMWSMWERQAIMLRINTSLAMSEISNRIAVDGGFMTKDGKWKTHLGREKGYKLSEESRQSISEKHRSSYESWKETSLAYKWVKMQVLNNRKFIDILKDFNELYTVNPKQFCTKRGNKMSKATLWGWYTEIIKDKG